MRHFPTIPLDSQYIAITHQISTDFALTDYSTLDDLIDHALCRAATFAGLERGFMILVSPDEQWLDFRYEWHDPSVISHRALLGSQTVRSTQEFAQVFAAWRDGTVLKIPADDHAVLPDGQYMHDLITLLNVRSSVTIPIYVGTRLVAAIGFSSTVASYEFSDEVVRLFTFVGEVISNALERKRFTDELTHQRNALEEMVSHRTRQLDITNRELQAANYELESFAYSVSHDLRSPLRSLDGFSQALLEDYGEQLDATAQDYVRRIRANSQRMGALIDDLLRLSRVTRNVILRVERVSLSEIVSQLATDLQRRDPTRVVEWVISPNLVVLGDRALLQLALTNLVENAWKFTQKKAKSRIELGERHDGNLHYFFIEDDGDGFDMAYVDKLFKAFQRLHNAREFEGNGIGLATVHRIMSRHGGRLWAHAEKGRGATFMFTFPQERTQS